MLDACCCRCRCRCYYVPVLRPASEVAMMSQPCIFSGSSPDICPEHDHALHDPRVCPRSNNLDSLCRFRGMLLERLDGRVVEKVIMRPEFADVHYLRAMLLSVFTALGKAQSWLGTAMACQMLPSTLAGLSAVCCFRQEGCSRAAQVQQVHLFACAVMGPTPRS